MRRQEVYVDYHGREYIPVHFSPDATVYLKHRSEINAGINNSTATKSHLTAALSTLD